ncbi:MAG: hypothetical protein EXR98_00500 [Gemmataceae bacterium]|nr:hypothetical protein [Gemmataceae bacterium]
MLRSLWKTVGRNALCGATLLAGAALVQAQDTLLSIPQRTAVPAVAPRNPVLGQPVATPTAAPTNEAADLKARIDRLEQQNRELMEMLKGMQKAPAATSPTSSSTTNALSVTDVRQIITGYFAEQEGQKKAAEKAQIDTGYVVGKQTTLSGNWKNHQPWFETADSAFRIHVGGRFQPDWVFGATADNAVTTGKGGTGAFQEGFNFRRARLQADGWIYEVIDFFVEYDFANQFSSGQPFTVDPKTGAVAASRNTDANTFGVPAPTDVWAGINYMPVVGGLRIGNLKAPIGLDHLTSSRYLDFLERSTGFDTYYNRQNGFEPGFMIFNYTENQRMSWQVSATKPNNTLFGWTTGGGEWAYTGRITALPWYEDEGRRMIHVGLGARFTDHMDQGRANLNARWLLREGGPNLQRLVAQANLFGDSQAIINPEFFMNLGPLSVQAEYIASRVTGVTSYITQLTGSTPVPVSSRSFASQTAYVQALYFLTGEHRPYSKSALHGSGAAPTRVVPNRNYFWVPGSGGNGNPFSAGAWQVGVRYCWSDLNDNGINGGIVNEVTLGLNWFLNPNMKIQWNYDMGHRKLIGGTSDGYYSGFGMRMAFDF